MTKLEVSLADDEEEKRERYRCGNTTGDVRGGKRGRKREPIQR